MKINASPFFASFFLQTESRDHRRWIQRNNAKLRQKSKKEETANLVKFVQAAYDNDPRIKRVKDAERAAKDARKQAKEDEKARREGEERAKKEAAERAKREAEEAEAREREEAKRRREEEKKLAKKERQRLRALCAGVAEDDELEKVFAKLPLPDLRAFGDAMERAKAEGGALRGCVEQALESVRLLDEAEEKRRQEHVRTFRSEGGGVLRVFVFCGPSRTFLSLSYTLTFLLLCVLYDRC